MTTARLAGAQSGTRLDQVASRIHEISTLPHIALAVIEVANDPNSGARELKEVMETDASLSARVLKCVNSSAYAKRTAITNLQQAVAYLGVQQIRNIAITASVSELFKSPEEIGTYRRIDLWKHFVAVAICGRLLAMRMHLEDFEDVFLAGLLHDIGIILEDQYLHKPFVEVMQSLKPGTTLSQAERAQFDFDHTALAVAVMKTWNFPPQVMTAMRYHHSSQAYQGEKPELLWCVEVANLICSLKGMSSVGVNLVGFPQHAIAGLELKKDDIVVLSEDLDREIPMHGELFQL